MRSSWPIFSQSETVPQGRLPSISDFVTIQPERPAICPKAVQIQRPISSPMGASLGSLSFIMTLLSLPSAIASGEVSRPFTCSSSVSRAGTARPAPSQSTKGMPSSREMSMGQKVLKPPSSTGMQYSSLRGGSISAAISLSVLKALTAYCEKSTLLSTVGAPMPAVTAA